MAGSQGHICIQQWGGVHATFTFMRVNRLKEPMKVLLDQRMLEEHMRSMWGLDSQQEEEWLGL